jgi:hypothetical protein
MVKILPEAMIPLNLKRKVSISIIAFLFPCPFDHFTFFLQRDNPRFNKNLPRQFLAVINVIYCIFTFQDKPEADP